MEFMNILVIFLVNLLFLLSFSIKYKLVLTVLSACMIVIFGFFCEFILVALYGIIGFSGLALLMLCFCGN